MDGERIVERGEVMWVKKRIMVSSLMNRIIMYSAMKIRAKAPALYSILNPETSSDSPSAKSNGERLVSARIEMNHIGVSGRIAKNLGIIELFRICAMSNESKRRRGESIIRAILTSYEIV